MKRIFLILLVFLMLLISAGCDNSSQEDVREKTLEDVREKTLEGVTVAELIKLQAIAVSMEYPEGGDHILLDGNDSEWNPVLEILSFDEATKTYSVKVDPRLMYGFRYITVTEEEFNRIQAWESEQGKKIIYPLCNPDNNIGRYHDADCWYLVSEDGLPIDENGNEIPYSEDMRLIPDYYFDKSGNLRYQVEMADETYRLRICVYTYFEFHFGRELTFPLSQWEESFVNVK